MSTNAVKRLTVGSAITVLLAVLVWHYSPASEETSAQRITTTHLGPSHAALEASHHDTPRHNAIVSVSHQQSNPMQLHLLEPAYDEFGNQVVNASMPNEALTRWLVADWPLYIPSDKEKLDGNINGCMIFHYYVSESAYVSLIVMRKTRITAAHFHCQFDHTLGQFQLDKLSRVPTHLSQSNQRVIEQLPLTKEPLVP